MLMTFVVVSCLRRRTLDEPGSSITEPGTGSKFNGKLEDSGRKNKLLLFKPNLRTQDLLKILKARMLKNKKSEFKIVLDT